MTAALFLGQNVNLTLELGVRGNRTRLSQNLTSFDLVTSNTTEQSTDVIAGFCIVQKLSEHLDTGYNNFSGFVGQTNDFNFVRHVQLTSLNSTGSNRTTAGDREDILDRHQEGQVALSLRSRDVAVNSVHQFVNASVFRSVRIGGGALQNL